MNGVDFTAYLRHVLYITVIDLLNNTDLQMHSQDTWNITDYDITTDIIKLLHFRFAALFDFKIDTNVRNSPKFIPFVSLLQIDSCCIEQDDKIAMFST